jgi:hypothetical protein
VPNVDVIHEQPKTTKELLDISTRHTSGEEAFGAAVILGNTGAAVNGGRAAPTKATIKGARKGAKGGKNGQKRQPHRNAIVAGNGDGDKEADDSCEEFVAAVESNFKRQSQPPKDHFEKLLEVTYLHHPYPVKHKLKDCTMRKKFMTSGTFSKGSKLGRDPGGKSAAPVFGEAKVMTIFD